MHLDNIGDMLNEDYAEFGWSLWTWCNLYNVFKYFHLLWVKDVAEDAIILPVSSGVDLEKNWNINKECIGYYA